jgi:hypothetical protein
VHDGKMRNSHGETLLHAPGKLPATADPSGGASALRAEIRSYVLFTIPSRKSFQLEARGFVEVGRSWREE